MKKNSQSARVIAKLQLDGEVSRNWALNQFPKITRLAALIPTLKGWELVGEERGSDYVYKVVTAPKPKPRQVVEQLADGSVRVSYQ